MDQLRWILALSILFSTGCSVVGIRTAEELKYVVVEEQNDFEIREYKPYIAAEAHATGERRESQSPLFRLLAGYIFGKNTTEESIAMTAPVVMEEAPPEDGEQIAMTAPVIMEESSEGTWKMAFSMPAEYTMEDIPKPLDERVKLVEIPARTLAVVRYSGSFNNREKRGEMEQALIDWLEQHPGYRAKGKTFYAGYDPPFTVPFLRRNEVLVEVERIENAQ